MDADDDRPNELLRRYAAETQPTAERRERTWAAIAAAGGLATPAAATSWWTAHGAKIGLAVATLAVVSGAALFSGGAREESTTTVALAPAATTAPVATTEIAAGVPIATQPDAPADPEPARATGTTHVARRPTSTRPEAPPSAADTIVSGPQPQTTPGAIPAPATSTLAEEIALLGAAQRALAHGDAQRALDTLDRHASTYPSSTLAADRDTARVTALCELGRDGEAHALATHLDARAAVTRALSHCRGTTTP